MKAQDNVISIHHVSDSVSPIYPPGVDVINAWCHSGKIIPQYAILKSIRE